MALFVMMTKVAPDTLHDARVRRAMGKEWLQKVKKACPEAKWIAHYALLGPYDFMDVYEAPDLETAHRVSLISRGEGALTVESWPALPYEQFMKQLERIPSA
jgi:uncharacterized protein with GYD domain